MSRRGGARASAFRRRRVRAAARHSALRGEIGTAFLGTDLRSLQNDEFANPGTLWVERGEKLWREPAGRRTSRAPAATRTP